MDNAKREKVLDALCTFVERAAGENATEAEIAALPSVARIALEYMTSA